MLLVNHRVTRIRIALSDLCSIGLFTINAGLLVTEDGMLPLEIVDAVELMDSFSDEEIPALTTINEEPFRLEK